MVMMMMGSVDDDGDDGILWTLDNADIADDNADQRYGRCMGGNRNPKAQLRM